ncbi:colicin immunity protein Cui [Escherichia coli]|uniref:colicin immunity protein Cui n=1 Tax=Escherichia coli TaxID=562 RepID=UPI000F89D018|nr:colicin immunity protein Cui [Escherichia coli]EFC7283960.1 colicin immunity protein Cui [Escherichia coli]MBS8284939.1 colicin immunity protein Cui [Escherichia coli]MEC6574978.1 colicin immunity protein Cui [Escherichia coli]HAW8468864.1 colicin immunity protein Cui [Escherichia coli]HBC3303275.1 colicin immunity protein Cui [Escherichia coli]
MMINEYSIKKNNRKANNVLYLFIVVGVIPLLCILAIYYKTPDNPLLQIIATSTKGIPSITSSYNPLMTKVMDIYCKTAPFLAFILFITTFKTRKLTKQLDKKTLTKACILSPLFYTITIYLFYFRSFDLMTSGRARLMADNNINLFILYSMLYISIFSMAYAFFYFPIIAYKLFKERQ